MSVVSQSMCSNVNHLQALALMDLCDWWAVPMSTKVEWSSAQVACGAQSVMTSGEMPMLLLCVGSWDTRLLVSNQL